MSAVDDRGVVWNHFILAQALVRALRAVTAAQSETIDFAYADTHAGPGRIPAPLPNFARVMAARRDFSAAAFFQAATPLPDGGQPGSWVLAGRIAAGFGETRLELTVDANDIDANAIRQARASREGIRTRLWSEDWFLFLRTRLDLFPRPNFVFIDPPPDDARGPAYGIDAAILLDALGVPYMLTYPTLAPQRPIDQIGRCGLELHLDGDGCGAVLGGGAEAAMLDLLGDLRCLAALLDGSFLARLPREQDYSI